MGVNVDQAGNDKLAARIDRLGGIGRDAGLDRRDPAATDRHITDRIETDRGVDDAPTFDDQIVACRKRR